MKKWVLNTLWISCSYKWTLPHRFQLQISHVWGALNNRLVIPTVLNMSLYVLVGKHLRVSTRNRYNWRGCWLYLSIILFLHTQSFHYYFSSIFMYRFFTCQFFSQHPHHHECIKHVELLTRLCPLGNWFVLVNEILIWA